MNDIVITLTGHTMGSDYRIIYLTSSEADFQAEYVKKSIEDIFDSINKQMSIHLEDSEISQFNRIAPNTLFKISNDFAEVVKESFQIHQLTGGGLDITLGNIVNNWGFGVNKHKKNLTEQCSYSTQTGMSHLSLQRVNGEIFLSKNIDLSIDLSAIGKGFASDKVSAFLLSKKIDNFLVEIGGEIFTRGKNPTGNLWRIGIENPFLANNAPYSKDSFAITVDIENKGLSTSSHSRSFYVNQQGEINGHEIDPMTLKPVKNSILSLTVITDSATRADGIATGLYTKGLEEALDIAIKNNLAICIFTGVPGDLIVHCSPEFSKYITQ